MAIAFGLSQGPRCRPPMLVTFREILFSSALTLFASSFPSTEYLFLRIPFHRAIHPSALSSQYTLSILIDFDFIFKLKLKVYDLILVVRIDHLMRYQFILR